MPGTTSARRFSLAGGLLLAALLGCTQTVVFDKRDGGLTSDGSTSEAGSHSDGNRDDAAPLACAGNDSRNVNVTANPVDVVVALDRSSGMNARFGDGSSYAAATSDALHMIVDRYQATIHFALVLFPGPSSCPGDPSCCVASVSPATTPGFMSAFDACAIPGNCPTSSQRPIAQALDSSYNFYFSNFDSYRYVLLLTSGDPGCTSSPGDGCSESAGKTSDLFKINVRTEVIAIGTSSGSGCLDRLAQNGSLAVSAGAATSASDIGQELDDFVRSIARDACRLDLHPALGSSEQLVVSQNDMLVPNDPTNGWDFDPFRSSIRLHGMACDRLLTKGVADLSVRACPDHH